MLSAIAGAAAFLIFFFDAIWGIYDLLSWEGPGGWRASYDYVARSGSPPRISVEIGEHLSFEYKISNRRFFPYRTNLEVSLWKDGTKVRDLHRARLDIPPFRSGKAVWGFCACGLEAPHDRGEKYKIKIKTDTFERELILVIYRTREL